MFATDRDVALLDPGVFRDLAWLGQVVTRGVCNLVERNLEATAIDGSLSRIADRSGMIVVVQGAVLEVQTTFGNSTMDVAMLRDMDGLDPLPPISVANAPFAVVTFRPQIELVHRQVLAMAGLRRAGGAGTELSEERVRNGPELAHLEALGTLHLIYAMAAAATPGTTHLLQRARDYREQFGRERARATVLLDSDGDGVADVVRRMGVMRLARG
jgi:hypothetical protein